MEKQLVKLQSFQNQVISKKELVKLKGGQSNDHIIIQDDIDN